MAPGGEMFRYPQHFGENVLPRGSHEWLPYSVDEVRLKCSNTNLSNGCVKPISTKVFMYKKTPCTWCVVRKTVKQVKGVTAHFVVTPFTLWE